MELKSKFSKENLGITLCSLFYLITGLLNLAVLTWQGFEFPHLALIGFLSLITAYGLFIFKRWVLWFVVVMFPLTLTYSFYTLQYTIVKYSFSGSVEILLFNISFLVYPILSLVALIYTYARKNNLR